MNKSFTHGYALLIGVGVCAHAPWSLPVTVKDAQALQTVLVDPTRCAYPAHPGHVQLLHDHQAHQQAILAGIDWLAHAADRDPDATALVYYSGHGWLDEVTGEYYLIPHDASPHDLPGTALAATQLNQALRAIAARRLWVILDCCHAGGMATAKRRAERTQLQGFAPIAPPVALLDELKRGAGRAVFTSSRGDQQSWVHPQRQVSIFTHHLLEALRGVANPPGERLVHLSNVMRYLSQRVPASAQTLCQAEQTPFFHMASEDFPVALAQGGKRVSSYPLAVKRPGMRIQHRQPAAVVGQRNLIVSSHLQNNTIVMGDHTYVQLS